LNLMSLTNRSISELPKVSKTLLQNIMVTKELALSTAATTVLALAQQPANVWDDTKLDFLNHARELFATLEKFLTAKQKDVRLIGMLAMDHPEQTFFITPKAITSIAESLRKVADAGRLSGIFPSPLIHRLVEMCEGQPAFDGAMESLHSLLELQPGHSTTVSEGAKEDGIVGSSSLTVALGTKEVQEMHHISTTSSEVELLEDVAVVTEVRPLP
jgi:hypothetical protein